MFLRFEYDERKSRANERKHDVSFQEGESVFYDPNARLKHDPDHSSEEDRFVLLGLSSKPRMIVVCHCYREDEEVIRIISARKATKEEEMQYQEFNR